MSEELELQLAPRCSDEHCLICGDAGVAARVLSVDSTVSLAVVESERQSAGVGKVVEEVDVTLVEPVEPGDRVLVHAGVAIARIDGATDD